MSRASRLIQVPVSELDKVEKTASCRVGFPAND